MESELLRTRICHEVQCSLFLFGTDLYLEGTLSKGKIYSKWWISTENEFQAFQSKQLCLLAHRIHSYRFPQKNLPCTKENREKHSMYDINVHLFSNFGLLQSDTYYTENSQLLCTHLSLTKACSFVGRSLYWLFETSHHE